MYQHTAMYPTNGLATR